MSKPTEGVDYIFDRYAFLHLDPKATDEEVRETIKKRMVENHPDAIEQRGDEIKAIAKRILALVDICKETLLDLEKRAAYDERLEWFKANKPQLISTDGAIKESPHEYRLDIPMLLQEGARSEGMSDEVVRQMTGYNPRKLESARRRYEKDPADQEFVDDYRDALQGYFLYLNYLEDKAWAHAGIDNHDKSPAYRPPSDPSFYEEEIAEEVERFAQHVIPSTIVLHSKAELSGLTKPIALLSAPGDSGGQTQSLSLISEEAIAWSKQRATEIFKSRTNRIAEVAKMKQGVVLSLLNLCPTHVLCSEPKESGNTEIILLTKEDDNSVRVMGSYVIDEKTMKAGKRDYLVGTEFNQLQQFPFKNKTYAIEINEYLDERQQVVYCCKKYTDRPAVSRAI